MKEISELIKPFVFDTVVSYCVDHCYSKQDCTVCPIAYFKSWLLRQTLVLTAVEQ
jgi:hypothetical protein